MTDDLYPKAKYLVLTEGKASTSYLQRRLQIGYNAAAALIERMEADGLVSARDHVGRRTIIGAAADVAQICAEVREIAGQPDAPPPWDDETPAPAPASTPPVDGTIYVCSGCDIEAEGHADHLPAGWYEQFSPSLGVMHRCPACAEKNAVRIATASMSTEEIAAAGADADAITGAAQTRLRTIIQRCQHVLDDLANLRRDLKEVLDEAKGEGFDVKTIRKLLTYLAKDPAKRQEEAEIFDLYLASIGEV